MKYILALIIWGIVASTMICKTSSGATGIGVHAPWGDQ